MDFNLSEEQQLLQDTVRRFVEREYGFEARRKIIATPAGWSEEVWRKLAELGLTAIPFAEEQGGLAGGGIELMVVMDALGRGLVVEPYLASVVLGGSALALAGSAAQKDAVLPGVAAGETRLALAHGERQARYELSNVATRARREGAGFVLDGAKQVVLGGDAAHQLLVSARTSGAERDPRGITLFLVDASAPGVAVRGYRTYDGQRAADLALTGVRVSADAVIGEVDGALPVIEAVTDRAIAALCGEAVGIMESLNAATLDYLKTRQQFGVPIGRFQVLQHRMAEMVIHFEQARSMACLAAMYADHADTAQRRRVISAAKAAIGQAARFIGQQAVQLHGGMGVVDELIVSHWFKRLTCIDRTLGDTEHHLARFGETMVSQA